MLEEYNKARVRRMIVLIWDNGQLLRELLRPAPDRDPEGWTDIQNEVLRRIGTKVLGVKP